MSMGSTSARPESRFPKGLLPELVGVLVPGMALVAVLAIALAPFAHAEWGLGLAIALGATPLGLVIVGILGYLVGHRLAGRGVDGADAASLRSLAVAEPDRVGACRRVAPSGRLDVDYPYLFLPEYLRDQGRHALADVLPWRGEDPDSHGERSIAFVERERGRLAVKYPLQYRAVEMAEARVRLLAGLWTVGFAGLLLIGASLIVSTIAGGLTSFPAALVVAALLIGGRWAAGKLVHPARLAALIALLDLYCWDRDQSSSDDVGSDGDDDDDDDDGVIVIQTYGPRPRARFAGCKFPRRASPW